MKTTSKSWLGGCSVALLMAACTGQVEGVPSGAGSNPAAALPPPTGATPGGPGGSTSVQSSPAAPAQIPGTPAGAVSTPLPGGEPDLSGLQRLSHRQIENTVADLFGPGLSPLVQGEVDFYEGGFASVGGRRVAISRSGLQRHDTSAKDLARAVASDPMRRTAWVTCTPTGPKDSACLTQFVTNVGRRLFRRTLTAAEVQRYGALANNAASTFGDFWKGAEYALRAFLLSPKFLHLVEVGKANGNAKSLTDIELASRISYFLWDSTPDSALITLAESNGLTPAGLTGVVERLAADRAKIGRGAEAFMNGWLSLYQLDDLEKDPTKFPMSKPDLFAAMKRSITQLGQDLIASPNTNFLSILNPGYTHVDAQLAALFGTKATGTGLTRFNLAPMGRRTGLLTDPAIMAINSREVDTSPTLRGLFVRRLLCVDAPPVPADVNAALGVRPSGQPKRTQLEAHSTNPACAGCHALIDPIGYGLEHFDALGRERETDNGVTVDARGNLLGSPFNGPRELSMMLAGRVETSLCLTRRLWAHGLGHEPTASEGHGIAALAKTFQSGGQMLATMIELAKSPAFRSADPGS